MTLKLGKNVRIHETARIDVEDGYIGDRSTIGAHALIEGRCIKIGTEAWIDEHAHIGGGSCHDPESRLEAGDFLHMGKYSHLNQARGLMIGHEFGCGINTKVFTHGAYESAWEGFPVQWGSVTIGDKVWMPNAWVNPDVRVGSNIVVAAMSVVTKDLPSGCFAGGVPCKVIKENAFPRRLTAKEKLDLFEGMFRTAVAICAQKGKSLEDKLTFKMIEEDVFSVESTTFDFKNRKIEGKTTEFSEILKNQLRRNGIRFRYTSENGVYVKW